MKRPGGRTGADPVRLGLAVLAGPASAVLHEAGVISIGPPATLWPIASVCLLAMCGLILAHRATAGSSPGIRWIAALPNGVVLLFYGFLLTFFALGGSR